MRRLVAGLALALIVAPSVLAARLPAYGPLAVAWTYDSEAPSPPYADCEGGVGENDVLLQYAEGTLAAGASYTLVAPQFTCYPIPARAAWRWLGNGKAPMGITVEVLDPGAEYRGDWNLVVQSKGHTPTWVQHCAAFGGLDAAGQFSFRVTNSGPGAVPIRFGWALKPAETAAQQCDAPGLGWPVEFGGWL